MRTCETALALDIKGLGRCKIDPFRTFDWFDFTCNRCQVFTAYYYKTTNAKVSTFS